MIKTVKRDNEESNKKDQSIVKYLNSIDFSLINDEIVIENIYKEILPASTELFKDPFTSESLEKLISLSSPQQLIILMNSVNKNVIFKKLGSRILEKIYERLFESIYKENKTFKFKDALGIFYINDSYYDQIKNSVICHNATFVVRKMLLLISGKSINKLDVEKFKINDENKDFSKEALENIKIIFKDLLKVKNSSYSTDFYNTLGLFLQITKSQSLIECVINQNLTDNIEDSIQNNGFLYEIIPTISNKNNMKLLYSKTKGLFKNLALVDKSSYFVQSFLRNSQFGKEIYKEFDNFDDFESNSNIVLAFVESFQKLQEYELVKNLISNYFKIEKSFFEEFLLKKYGSIDTKYVNLIINFMNLPKRKGFEVFYNVNKDFLIFFKKDWIKNKSGIKLIIAFIKGFATTEMKSRFIEDNIDLFKVCMTWKEGKDFMKMVCNLTKGHTRKRAYEILNKK